MNAPLPGPLNDNPSLDRWVAFPSPGKVTVLTGRVELGQGVLTAMAQIAADELDVAMERITRPLGRYGTKPRTRAIPPAANRSSLAAWRCGRRSPKFARCFSIMRRKCSPARPANSPFATAASIATANRPARTTGRLPAPSTLQSRQPAPLRESLSAISRPSARTAPRLDLPAKVFGQSVFIHDMQIDGMVHARVVRQPNRGATIGAIDEDAIRRAAKGSVEFVRHGNFLAILGNVETAVEAAGAAAVEPRHLAQRRSADRDPAGGQLAAATAGGRSALRGGAG